MRTSLIKKIKMDPLYLNGEKGMVKMRFFCCVCMKKFSVAWGFEALEQHASSKKHIEQSKVKLAEFNYI